MKRSVLHIMTEEYFRSTYRLRHPKTVNHKTLAEDRLKEIAQRSITPNLRHSATKNAEGFGLFGDGDRPCDTE